MSPAAEPAGLPETGLSWALLWGGAGRGHIRVNYDISRGGG